MKSIKLWLLLLLGFVTTTMFAQPTKEAPKEEAAEAAVEEAAEATETKTSSLLWEISGNGLEQPSYLFGTIHLIAKDDYFWTDVMNEKFNTTEMLVLEIDMENPMMMMIGMLGSMRMKKGTSLQDLLTKEEYKLVSDYFMDEMGMPLSTFDRIKPMFTSMMMAEGGQNMEATTSYEMELMEKAKVREMKIEGLETAKYQMSMFDSIPYEDQAQMLVATVKGEGEDESAASLDDMVELYKQQDIDGLYKLIMQDDSGMENFEDILLITRNKNWIPKIEKMSAKKPTFFAVGAGHLPGEQGVINLLKAQGYSVTPIR